MRPQTSPQRGYRLTVLAAVAGAIVFLVVSSACGGDDGGGIQLSGQEVSAAGVTLSLPEGWAFLDNDERGLVLASREEDLRADTPGGPRLTVEPGGTAPPDPEELVSAIAGEDGAPRVEVVEEPETVPVGVEEGVSIGLLEEEDGGAVIRRYVIVNVDGINVYQFLLEAPEDQWDDSVDTLEAVLGSAAFEPPVAAEAPTATTEAPIARPTVAPSGASPFDSFHYTVDMEFTISEPGEEAGTLISVSVEGDFVAPDSHAFTSKFEFAGLSGTQEVVIIGDDAWLREGSGDWVQTTSSDPDVLDAIDLTSADPDFLWDEDFARNISVLDSQPETLDGVQTRRYHIPREAVDMLASLLGQGLLQDTAGLEEFEMTVWLEEETRALVRAEFTATASPELIDGGAPFDVSPDATLNVAMSIRLTSLNDPSIEIEPPL